MQFYEAMKLLQEGKKVRACSWGPDMWIAYNCPSGYPDLFSGCALEEWELFDPRLHECTGDGILQRCWEDGHGYMWLLLHFRDGSSITPVTFCPFCGYKLPEKDL